MRSKGLLNEPFRSVYLPPDTPVVERDTPAQTGQQGKRPPVEAGWGRETDTTVCRTEIGVFCTGR